VSFAVEEDISTFIAPEILETVFTNLLDNSRQNGADRVDIKAGRSNGHLSVTVVDNGQGISPANVDKIFTPFFTTHRDQGGTGLGLGIVRSLLKAYGGDISLDAGANGATFRVTIPAVGS
jgi:signal transduction histidine kinase